MARTKQTAVIKKQTPRKKKSKSRKRKRSTPSKSSNAVSVDAGVLSQLTNLGFNTHQIEEAASATIDDQSFDVLLEVLLANNSNNNDDLDEPSAKRRKVDQSAILSLDDDDDDDHRNKNSNTNTNTQPKPKTQLQLQQEEFSSKQQEIDDRQSAYQEWRERQTTFQDQLVSVRDHIQKMCDQRPCVSSISSSSSTTTTTDAANTMTMEDLLSERHQLVSLIEHAYNHMQQHLLFCNECIDSRMVAIERKQQAIEMEQLQFVESLQEFESQKCALQLMQNEVKAGTNVMSLAEHNLFVVASAMDNSAANNIDCEHFKSLHEKIKIIQNQNTGSNSKQEKDAADDEMPSIDTEEEEKKSVPEDAAVTATASFECEICFTSFTSLDDILIFDECYHFYCVDCLRHTVGVKVSDRNVNKIGCPHSQCDHVLTHQEIGYILSKEEFKRYDACLLDKTLDANKECCRCPGVDCGVPMFGYHDTPMLTCPKCSKQFCFNCGTEDWHKGVTCDAFKQWKIENGKGDMRFEEWTKKHSKRCPQCNQHIEKNGGCDHMTCSNCKYEFHWKTMEKWKGYQHVYPV